LIYKVEPDKVKTVYNGVCSNYQFSEEELNETRKLLNLDDRPLILFVGRVDDPRKDLHSLLNAFKLIMTQIDAILLIVGSGDQIKAKRLAQYLGISHNVVFTGFVADDLLKKLYAICDVFVSTSRLEGFGLTIVEAMAAGKPVVARHAGALPELVRYSENSILIKSDEADELTIAILAL
jgi:glycosyltransferase involved in cell wall biosynthesis